MVSTVALLRRLYVAGAEAGPNGERADHFFHIQHELAESQSHIEKLLVLLPTPH